jgi:RNA polymerase sigma-70 factor (ECF subfamily)
MTDELPFPADEELVTAAQTGDGAAFATLLDRHLPHVRTFLALKAPVPRLVDELAHDTFVFAYRHLDEFVPGTSLRAWLRAIAWNLLRAEVQRFARERVQLERFAAWQLEEWTATAPEPSAEAEHLVACVAELPEPLRQLVALKYQHDHSGDEIAARLGRSAVWVRVSLFRVRQMLRDCVERKTSPA